MTGSLFLLALAVIGLPMLLDGAGLPARELPDMPSQATFPPVEPLASHVPESDYVARVQALRNQVDADGFLTSSGSRFGEPVLTPDDEAEHAPAAGDAGSEGGSGAAAWAVQVASFARAGNAEAFRTRLRRDGYEAFISTAKISGRVLSRVAVGPLLDRVRAQTLRSELAARYDVHARLMAFSN